MTKWEAMEEWLYENYPLGGTFTSEDVANIKGVPRNEASEFIQAHLGAQRGAKAQTLYVIYRTGRTSKAQWTSGVRTADAREVGYQYFDDVRRKFVRAVEPDLKRIAVRNKRAARQCEAIVEAVADGAMKVLQAAVGLHTDDGDGGSKV